MTDRTILDNARNILLVTAGSFCLSMAGFAAASGNIQRPNQEARSQSKECKGKQTDAPCLNTATH